MNAMQCRMARVALRMSVIDLAVAAKVAPGTVSRLEGGEELKPRTVEAMQRALEEHGAEFIDGDAPGVRIHPRPAAKRKAKR